MALHIPVKVFAFPKDSIAYIAPSWQELTRATALIANKIAQEEPTIPQIYQDIAPAQSLVGKRVLLFDDVADSGESLIFGKQYLEKLGVAHVRTATIYTKPSSRFIPDYFASTTGEWIIFPFEVRETKKLLCERWKEQGVSVIEQDQRLQQLGLENLLEV